MPRKIRGSCLGKTEDHAWENPRITHGENLKIMPGEIRRSRVGKSEDHP
jgi:hypothetical protein